MWMFMINFQIEQTTNENSHYNFRLSPNATSPSNLTLEQKQKMIKDSENLQRLQNQGQLVGSSISPTLGSTSSNKQNSVKDLTDTLMSANLNR